MGYYGQNGEDQLIEQYFPDGYIGTCIDIGATDGRCMNNTLHFEELGWNALTFEPNPAYFYQCQERRKYAYMYAISNYNADDVDFFVANLDGYGIEEAITGLRVDENIFNHHVKLGYNPVIKTIKTQVRTLNWVLENISPYTIIDFVSIDTEGTEIDVLEGFNIEKYKPKLFVIENNFEDTRLDEYMTKFGYVKDKRVSNNDFFVRKNEINMDTFGNLIDKLTIVNLKIWKFEDIKRDSDDDKTIADATRKTNILNQQRNDLIQEIDQMLIDASKGIVNFTNYNQGDTKSYGS